jgi:hypothetical protein
MNPAKVVMHVVDRYRSNVVLDLLGKRICEPREPAHVHTHGKVLALDVAGADMLRIRVTYNRFLLAASALRGKGQFTTARLRERSSSGILG